MLEVSIYVLGMAWLARFALWRHSFRFHAVMIPLAAATLWGLLQLALNTSAYRFVTWNAVLKWTSYFVLFSVCFQIFVYPRLRSIFLAATLYLTFSMTLAAVVWHFTVRTSAFFINRDHFSAFVELFLPLAIFTALQGRRRFWLHALIAGTLFASLIASASRAGVVLGTIEMAAISVLAIKRSTLDRKQILAVAAFAFVFTATVGWQVAWRRLRTPDPFLYRREMVVSSLAMLRDRPYFGFGLGTWETVYPAYALFDEGEIMSNAHNDWVEWAAEGGTPFLLIVSSLFVISIPFAVRSIWGLGGIAVLLHSFVSFPMQLPAIASLVFMILAAAAASGPSSSRERVE